jgi:hypothetical protein
MLQEVLESPQVKKIGANILSKVFLQVLISQLAKLNKLPR